VSHHKEIFYVKPRTHLSEGKQELYRRELLVQKVYSMCFCTMSSEHAQITL